MNSKMQWLRNKLSSMNLQGMIVSNPVNVQYLTNIQAEGMLILTRKENIYITDGRYIEHVNKTLTIYDEITVEICLMKIMKITFYSAKMLDSKKTI